MNTNTNSRTQVLPFSWTAAIVAAACAFTSCTDSRAGSAVSATTSSATSTSANAGTPLAEYRAQLLDLAFEASSAFPRNPHIKNRSRAQEAVVSACLELDQPERAQQYIPRIDNWRRGKAYADLAYHQAKLGRMADVQKDLDLAQRIADGGGIEAHEPAGDSVEAPQEWRRDRIRTSIARTYLLLGQDDKAAAVAEGAVESEIGRMHSERARQTEPADFDVELVSLDDLVGTGSFEHLNAALRAYAQLFDRFYDDAKRRATVESKIDTAWAKLPIQVRLDVLMELTQHAFAHADAPKALELIGRAQALLDGTRWSVESHVPLSARLAGLRFGAGDRERARADADAALAAYDSGRASVTDIYRAGVLRPLAEAYVTMGDTAKARRVYALAVEEGVVNPNSRPRAEDISATATSMAVHGFEPDAELLARMQTIRAGLGDPW
jgi:tetratricopeptide (TPR) repeat protein